MNYIKVLVTSSILFTIMTAVVMPSAASAKTVTRQLLKNNSFELDNNKWNHDNHVRAKGCGEEGNKTDRWCVEMKPMDEFLSIDQAVYIPENTTKLVFAYTYQYTYADTDTGHCSVSVYRKNHNIAYSVREAEYYFIDSLYAQYERENNFYMTRLVNLTDENLSGQKVRVRFSCISNDASQIKFMLDNVKLHAEVTR